METIGYGVRIESNQDITIGTYRFKSRKPITIPVINESIREALLKGILTLPDVANFEALSYAGRLDYINSITAGGASPFCNSAISANQVTSVEIKALDTVNYAETASEVSVDAKLPNGNMLVGTGIPSYFINVDRFNDIECYLAAYNHQIAGVKFPSAVRQPNGIPKYTVQLTTHDERVRMLFGVTLLSPNDGTKKITDVYNVQMIIADATSETHFNLVPVASVPQAYNWTSVEKPAYVIKDSITNSYRTTTQNVTQVTYLITEDMLDTNVLPGNYTMKMTMTHKSSGVIYVSQIDITVLAKV